MEDPWDAFETYMRGSAEHQAADLALSEASAERPSMMRDAALGAGMPDLMAELVGRAKDAGSLRPDAGVGGRPDDDLRAGPDQPGRG